MRTEATGIWRKIAARRGDAGNSGTGRARPARPRQVPARPEWLETGEGRMPAPPAAVGRDDVRVMGQPRPLQNEERIYVEPSGAPEIGRRPLDLNDGQRNVAQTERIMMRPTHLCREVPVYDDPYRAATARRIPHRGGMPAQPRLAKLDIFKGENREWLDDFVY